MWGPPPGSCRRGPHTRPTVGSPRGLDSGRQQRLQEARGGPTWARCLPAGGPRPRGPRGRRARGAPCGSGRRPPPPRRCSVWHSSAPAPPTGPVFEEAPPIRAPCVLDGEPHAPSGHPVSPVGSPQPGQKPHIHGRGCHVPDGKPCHLDQVATSLSGTLSAPSGVPPHYSGNPTLLVCTPLAPVGSRVGVGVLPRSGQEPWDPATPSVPSPRQGPIGSSWVQDPDPIRLPPPAQSGGWAPSRTVVPVAAGARLGQVRVRSGACWWALTLTTAE